MRKLRLEGVSQHSRMWVWFEAGLCQIHVALGLGSYQDPWLRGRDPGGPEGPLAALAPYQPLRYEECSSGGC